MPFIFIIFSSKKDAQILYLLRKNYFSYVGMTHFSVGCRIPIWYTVKLLLVSWLVLPQFRGAAFIYEKFVREKIRKYAIKLDHKGFNAKGKIK